MDKPQVAIIGGGAAGLSALKNLKEVGFQVTLYERKEDIGGLWTYTDNEAYTSIIPSTRANSSKYVGAFSDFPFPTEYGHHLTAQQFSDYFKAYARHFSLYGNININTEAINVARDKSTQKWVLTLRDTRTQATSTASFDRVVYALGLMTKPYLPNYQGISSFKGTIMHAQAYRRPDKFTGKKVIVIGIGNSAADIATDLATVAKEPVYLSHRSGQNFMTRLIRGAPFDIYTTWKGREAQRVLERTDMAKWVSDTDKEMIHYAEMAVGKLDPSWGFSNPPSLLVQVPSVTDTLIPLLKSGDVVSVKGFKRFIGANTVELADGTMIEDVDAVISCTGYTPDKELASMVKFTEVSGSESKTEKRVPLPRLYNNIFPPGHQDTIAFLNYSAPFENASSVMELMSMAIGQVWRGNSSLPSEDQQIAEIDEFHRYLLALYQKYHRIHVGQVKIANWMHTLHVLAGTGLPEYLGWGWKAWWFWLTDRKMSDLMYKGIYTPHLWRYFETGKRKAWAGAKENIIRVNKEVEPLIKGFYSWNEASAQKVE